MSFTGDLEHIPIVDVIQLLHSTRKSGTLCVRGRKGECHLVFQDGYIVSASHCNNQVRIGSILVEMKAIGQQTLDEALAAQVQTGGSRPLIAVLIEQGKIAKKTAYKGLETLIEMTVVEMLTWTSGQFALNVGKTQVSDEYRYFPEKLNQPITLDTQMVLMDALRIFDEKMRDGELEMEPREEAYLLEEIIEERGAWQPEEEETSGLSADLLGLENLDEIEREIPQVFKSLGSFDPSEIHSQVIRETLPGLPPEEQDELLDFLMIFTSTSALEEAEPPVACGHTLVVFTQAPFMRHAVLTLCKHEGLLVYAAESEEDLIRTLETLTCRGDQPLLVYDSPQAGRDPVSSEEFSAFRKRIRTRYPGLSDIQFAAAQETDLMFEAYRQGCRAALPRPMMKNGYDGYAHQIIQFLETFLAYVHRVFLEQEHRIFHKLRECSSAMQELKEAPDVSQCLLSFVTDFFERSLTFVVRANELVAEQGIGILSEKSAGPTGKLKLCVPLEPSSLLQQVVGEGRLFFQDCDDPVVEKHLFAAVAPPTHPRILLLPIRTRSKTIALIYADFGALKPTPVPTEILEILAIQAGLSLENALCRKQLEKLTLRK